jgi:D-alanyl-D-alanine carboxypeptidase (penicillin-binding protein 5/6)
VNTIRPTVLKNRFFSLIFILTLFFACASEAQGRVIFFSRRHQASQVTALAVYAVDYTNNQVLFSQNPRLRLFPASTVKLLTALVVLDHKDLKDSVVVSSRAVRVQPTKAGLSQGAAYTIEDLLQLLLVASANDAAVALAEAVAGSQEEFAGLMNEKAKALGTKDSFFTNPTGLPDKREVSSAYDLSIISRAALSRPFIASAMKKKVVSIVGSDGKRIARTNHNKMLWRVSYPVVLGKTGYTSTARHCYAGIAYYDDRRVSFVFLKSRKPWLDIYTILGIPKRHH